MKDLCDNPILRRRNKMFIIDQYKEGETIPKSGLVMEHIYGNGNALDTSGNGNNGTINGATFVAGGLSFDGLNDYVSVPSISLLNTHSLSYYGKVLGTSAARIIMGNLIGEYILGTHAANRMYYNLSSGNNYIPFPNDNADHFVVVTRNSLNLAFYYDGIKTLSSIGTTQPITVDRIGFRATQDYFYGTIYNLRLYNRELTDSEATTLYNLRSQ